MKKLVLVGAQRLPMKKADVENELSCLLGGQRVSITSEVQKGVAFARCSICGWKYEGEAKSIDWAYRALLMEVRKDMASGRLRPVQE